MELPLSVRSWGWDLLVFLSCVTGTPQALGHSGVGVLCVTFVLAPHIGVSPLSLSLPSRRSLWIMCLDEVGVARLPLQQLNSYLYCMCRNYRRKKVKLKKKMTE